ncbi:MAG: tetratricopeptide repeat protein [Burkholderiaceae bacterium]|jgi:predicted O-linked N-acetylglucosamine transferase (SPINDLY family)|nr:tetratricopeptide repeat protein [Burkholderiaceae bacterium]
MKRSVRRPIPNGRGPKASAGNTLDAVFAQAMQLYGEQQYETALRLCRQKLLPTAPRHPSVLCLAGVLCFMVKDYGASERYLRESIAAGETAEAHTNLGLTLTELHRQAEAESSYRRAVELDPNQAQAWNNLGNILRRSHHEARKKEGLQCYRQAIAARPDYATAYSNLGYALENLKDYAGAEKNYRQALAYNPRHLGTLINLAELLDKTGQTEQALHCYRQAAAFYPQNTKILGSALKLRRNVADWDAQATPRVEQLLAALPTDRHSELQPMNLLALVEADAKMQLLTAQRFANAQWATQLAQPPLVSLPAPPLEGKLRIGYLSADFRNHPVAHLITDVIAAHDRERFEVFLYSYGPLTGDKEQLALRELADHFVVINDFDDDEAAGRIRADNIAVLIDLTGFTTHARAGINALRPAPVIASWIGYVGTMGEPRMADYIIGDAIVTPPEMAANYSEALALMPECFQPNRAWCALPPPPPRADEGLPEDAVVLCSFNQTYKLNPQLWDDWCSILRLAPEAVLWLAPASQPLVERNLRHEAARRGIDAGRLIFAQRKPLNQHHARIALADLALDTFPYNSGATASDTLRAGVPLITQMGDTFCSRMAASLLHAIGLPELVTTDRNDYVRLAADLARDGARRQALRGKLARLLPESNLFNPQRLTRQFEALCLAMYAQAQTGQRNIITVV